MYSNSSELWLRREKTVQKIYNDIYNRTCSNGDDTNVQDNSREEFVAEFCNFSGIWNWIGIQHVCHFGVNGLYLGLDLLDSFSDKISSEESTDFVGNIPQGTQDDSNGETQETTATEDIVGNMGQEKPKSWQDITESLTQETQEDIVTNSTAVNMSQGINESSADEESGSKHNKCPNLDLLIGKEYILGGNSRPNRTDFGKNYSLFDLFEYYGMLLKRLFMQFYGRPVPYN